MGRSDSRRRGIRRWQVPVGVVVILSLVLGSLTLLEQTGAGASTRRTTWSAPAAAQRFKVAAGVAVGNPGLATLEAARAKITTEPPAAVPGAVLAAFNRATAVGIPCRQVRREIDRVIARLRRLERRYPFLGQALDRVIRQLLATESRICRGPSGG